MRCDYCGVEQSAVLGTTKTHCAPPFERRRHAFTGKHPADAKDARCDECNCLLPAHYGSCSHVAAMPGMSEALAAIDREAEERRGRERKRLGELDDMQASGRERLRGKFRALAMDTKLMSYDRDVMRQLIMLSDSALDALSLAIRG